MITIANGILMAQVLEAPVRAASEYMNGRAPDLPPIQWSIAESSRSVELWGYAEDDENPAGVAEIAERWRAALGMDEPFRDCGDGSRSCIGMSDFGATHLWYISDRERWEVKR